MLNMLSWNFNRGANDLRLFEMGNVFALTGDKVSEHKHLCLAASGATGESGIFQKPRLTDFFDLKGDAEDLLALFSNDSLLFDPSASDFFHPGRSAKVMLGGKIVGELGQLHPNISAERKLKQEIWLSFFDVDRLSSIPLREPRYERLSRYPAVERDFSLLLDNSTSYAKLHAAVLSLQIPELRSIEPHELFRGSGVPERRYSLLLRLKFQSTDRTLRDDEVATWSAQIVAEIQALGGTLRS
jgi:phenylalanyl-tRNA synthetase beta chain